MPVWVWVIVVGGLSYGLLEVGLRERRTARRRLRQLRARSRELDLDHHHREHHHEISVLLHVLPDLDHPGRVAPVFTGVLDDGTPIRLFDCVEGADLDQPVPRTGFVLDLPTAWPTYEVPGRRATGVAREPEHREAHDFAQVLLGSALCDVLAAHAEWYVAFSGGSVVALTHPVDGSDLDRGLLCAERIVDAMPAALVERWAVEPGRRQHRRRAS